MLAKLLEARRRGGMEAELPWLLRGMGVELGMGAPFERALARAGQGNSQLACEFKIAFWEISSGGSSAQDALARLGARAGSLPIKRAVAELVHCYENGGNGDGLKRLAAELVLEQKAKAKEFAARASLLGLAFMACSCIVPSLFLALSIVGSSFMGAIFTPLQIWLFFLAGFPLLGAGIIGFSWLITPAGLIAGDGGGVFGECEIRHVDALLKAKGMRAGIRQLALPCLSLSSLLGLSAYFGLEWLGMEFTARTAGALILFLSPFLAYFYLSGLVRARGARMEKFLPDALFQASSMQNGAGFERIVASIARSGYGPLSEEFASAHRQMRAGVGVVPSLEGIALRSDSLLVRRSVGLLAQAYCTGAEMGGALRDAAQDAFEASSELWERKGMLAVQRYTALFSGFLVPIILGMIAGTVAGLGSFEIEGMGASPVERAGLLSASLGAAQAYIAIFALLASVFASMQGGEWKKFVLYFAILAPLGLALFGAARAYSI